MYLTYYHDSVCYLTVIIYTVVRQISMLFIDNKISVFCMCAHTYVCTRMCVCVCVHALLVLL